MQQHEHSPRPSRQGHSHGVVDPTIATTSRGIWAIKWSFVGLGLTALLQIAVFVVTGSTALLADTVHNIGDAFTAVPLWIAFQFARKAADNRFTYGYRRVEDLAGLLIVLVILISGLAAGYESIKRLLHPQEISYIWAVAAAGAIGFIGNEAVALLRIKVGREISSAALVADGHHARIDGLTSLGVVVGAVAVWAGYPVADPVVGLIITALIGCTVWGSGKAIFSRILDGVEPDVIQEIRHEASHVDGVLGVKDVRARWLGHYLAVEVSVAASNNLSLAEAHQLGVDVSHRLSHTMPVTEPVVHVDPVESAGAEYHRIPAHEHDGLPVHAH